MSESEYEWAVETKVEWVASGSKTRLSPWTSENIAKARFNGGGKEGVNQVHGAWTRKLVRRRKAGPIEYVNEGEGEGGLDEHGNTACWRRS